MLVSDFFFRKRQSEPCIWTNLKKIDDLFKNYANITIQYSSFISFAHLLSCLGHYICHDYNRCVLHATDFPIYNTKYKLYYEIYLAEARAINADITFTSLTKHRLQIWWTIYLTATTKNIISKPILSEKTKFFKLI